MKWRVDLSRQARDFMESNHIEENIVTEKVMDALRRFQGEDMNVDIKKLHAPWEGYHRVRMGKLRMILKFQFEQHVVSIDEIDFRGNVYK